MDHIKPWAEVKGTEAAFDVANGRVLCRGCHADQATTPALFARRMRRTATMRFDL